MIINVKTNNYQTRSEDLHKLNEELRDYIKQLEAEMTIWKMDYEELKETSDDKIKKLESELKKAKNKIKES